MERYFEPPTQLLQSCVSSFLALLPPKRIPGLKLANTLGVITFKVSCPFFAPEERNVYSPRSRKSCAPEAKCPEM